MPFRDKVRTLGLAGTGVIGAGWAARALARGLDVVAWDPAPGAEARLREAVDDAWPALRRLRLWPDGGERLLGMGHPHGRRVEWLVPERA